MPHLLRGIFRRRRELLLDLSQCAAEALAEYMRIRLGPDTRPGIVVSIATSGDLLQWHPHGHILVTEGAFSDDGAFHPLETWDADAVMKLFRAPLSLKKLVYLDGQKAVLYRSRMNPFLGRNFEAMDPLEWLARLADQSAWAS